MDESFKLRKALFALKKNLTECPIDAEPVDAHKPIEEKIRNIRMSLISLNSRIQRLKAQIMLHSIPDPPEGKRSELVDQLQMKLSNSMISNNLLSVMYQSKAVQEIFSDDTIDPEIRNKTKAIMNKLFNLNDTAMNLHHEYNDICLNEELELKDKCVQMITEFSEFLRNEEGIRNEKLAKSNPEAVEKKEKILKYIHKINTMKKLITNFISIASSSLREQTELYNYLKKHRDLIRLETVTEMSRESSRESSRYKED